MSELYQKQDLSFLLPLALRFARWLIPAIPTWVKPNHLTVVGFLMFTLAGLSYYFASFNKFWLLLAPVAVFMHCLTDRLDGELARSRNLSSEQGFFLDLFLDNLGGTVVALGLAFSSYTVFEIIVVKQILTLLSVVLILFWIVLKRIFPLPSLGPIEIQLILIILSVLTFFQQGNVFRLGAYSLGWFDIAALLLIPLSLFKLLVSATKLYQELKPIEQP
jgi:phosphatidylglycerophosphate synthase